MTVEEHSVEQKLFSDEPLVRTRVDKRVILSLYGDDSSPRKTVTQVPSQYRTDEPQSSVPQFPLQPDAAAPESVPVPDPVIETVGSVVLGGESVPHVEIPHKKVLGETLANQTAAVNEVIGKKAAHTDVASRLRASQITDLRHSIGINDRFLLIRDLFGGKAEEYERVIDELDAFTELDDAIFRKISSGIPTVTVQRCWWNCLNVNSTADGQAFSGAYADRQSRRHYLAGDQSVIVGRYRVGRRYPHYAGVAEAFGVGQEALEPSQIQRTCSGRIRCCDDCRR